MSFWSKLSFSKREEDLGEEMKAHIDMAVRDRVERGENPSDARNAVLSEFGNMTQVQEVTHDIWAWASLDRIWQDVQYSLRMMRRTPAFTAIAILSLALGIGANTAIFSLIQGVMLRMLPVQDPEQLVELLSKYPGEP